MKIHRKFTTQGRYPFDSVEWVRRSSRITNPDGSVVFEMKDAEVPSSWSQLATDIMVSKYFRKAGVPQCGGPNGLACAPTGDREAAGIDGPDKQSDTHKRPQADGRGSKDQAPTGPERSARQVIHRLAGCWRHFGEKHGYFDSPQDAQAFYDELCHMMVHQMCAPNSPQWFNTGLHWAYGINGPAQGHWVADHKSGKVTLARDAYSHPQPHACFIQSVDDDLVNPGGIMDLWVREARLFKYGSGTGTNFSRLRGDGERLSGGGKSSGLMSWLRIGDRAASAIKSGGTTRRAAKMVCLDMDHPDIHEFINWKVREEIKVASLVEGLKLLKAKRKDVRATAQRIGLDMDYDFNGEAYLTVSGQNSNNSVRIPDEFFEALDSGGSWSTTWRINGQIARTFDARELWDSINYAAWRCADPGVQYDSTINAWHTCPGAGRINASNPCSEYMFLDNTACNLASLNVLKFYDAAARSFDVDAYEHAIDLWTIVLEISVLMAAFPSREIAELSWKYRTLGLGYANLGAMLMQAGIAYDSDEARAVCACLSAILTGRSYRKSAELARELGPFAGFPEERESMLRVIRNHRRAAHGVRRDSEEWEGINPATRPVPIDHDLVRSRGMHIANSAELGRRSMLAWDDALKLGERFGFRNAQVTVIAPTGTIGLLMDCDTTGVEPDFALVKFKKLAGGGYFKIANASVEPALHALGYDAQQVDSILEHLLGTLHLDVPMPAPGTQAKTAAVFSHWLRSKGMTDADLLRVTEALPTVFELSFAFGPYALGDECLSRLGIDAAKAKADRSFNTLRALGLDPAQIESLNEVVCGRQTIEGAADLKHEHLPVFDCANKCGRTGVRFIAPSGHILMMASAQPFISGAISKTINLPREATVEDVASCYRMSWELGLKANALYRDGCKLSQPLSSSSDEGLLDEADDEQSGSTQAKEEVAASVARVAALSAQADAGQRRTDDVVREVERIVERPMRRRLPDTRSSITHKFNIAGHEGYLNVGLYDDGSPGELFITMAKEGSTIGGLMDSLGTAVSVALQYGVPVESLVKKFSYQRFEPAGMTANPDIPFAKSLVDYIFRWLGMQFIQGYREEHAPRRPASIAAAAEADSSDLSIEPAASTEIAGPRFGRGAEPELDTPPSLPPPRRSNTSRATDRRSMSPSQPSLTLSIQAKADTPYPDSKGQPGEQITIAAAVVAKATSALSASTQALGDAPACEVCGEITVRNGTCYKCLNCGATTGCS